jgi:3-oxoacyl-[acyl-carrier protein] reductase
VIRPLSDNVQHSEKFMNTLISGTLTGKIGMVTGGSRGIGAAIARKLASDGAVVAITYNESAERSAQLVQTIESTGGKAFAIQADVSNPQAIRLAVATIVEKFGRIDILVNGAGALVVANIDTFSIEDFERMIAVNIRGVFVTTQEAARHMPDGAESFISEVVTATAFHSLVVQCMR